MLRRAVSLTLRFRHRVNELIVDRRRGDGRSRRHSRAERRRARRHEHSRNVIGDFEMSAQAVIVTSGGIGANHDLVRKNWPARLGALRADAVGVPRSCRWANARDLRISRRPAHQSRPHVALRRRNPNWNPIWPNHGIQDSARALHRCGSTPTAGDFPFHSIPGSIRLARSLTS